jgi:hypothetical protein
MTEQPPPLGATRTLPPQSARITQLRRIMRRDRRKPQAC